MKWIILVAIILAVIWLSKRSKSASVNQNQQKKNQEKSVSESKTYVTRQGQSVEADDVFHAWTSGSLSKMVDALESKTNLIDRHFLLMGIVDQAYKNRSVNENAALLQSVSEMHIAEFPTIKPALEKEMDGILPRVTTFQKYATFLTEKAEYEKAIEVCEQAIAHGLHDGTKSGFEGRIERIKKKMPV
ncbi:hypothetical protein [Alcanivorax sp.]|uniref:hypothetical protein n=1 Tax=Alcanivorax sp. TaxID=1872427 RepID=UPI000C65491F|nr:hypothetical protein [Alcanivorax sp.]MBQ25085.1 hypothetical protein [Alcanivorax sp.]|tara:strand:- start:91 stop:654 length:564 start_codon:yes stop_codon:yes gene_type:complete